ncbi:MAG: polyhydroxyalkanoate depolymerase [Pseudomonadota bacterium]
MLYHAYEYTHAAMGPLRAAARLGTQTLRNPFNPYAMTLPARATAAAFEMFINATKRYGKPEFGIEDTEIQGEAVPVVEVDILRKPFCALKHFRRDSVLAHARNDPKVLIVAPMSGHFATLLRGTVEAMLPEHDVYITDWIDARDVPLSEGRFDLADYTDYITEFCQLLARDGERVSVMAVCQPGVPCAVSAALMAEDDDPARPASLIIMGSPIDTRISPTEPTRLAESHPLSWFEKNVVAMVPWPNLGFLRRVYPGFLQLSGFMQMNLDRHVDAHVDQFRNLVRGDGDSAAAHRTFYDEYLAVMDLTAEFYLQTVDVVFQRHLLPLGEYRHRGRLVDLGTITDTAIMSVEGEKDDITGRGQTEAIHALTPNLPAVKHFHYTQPKVGHYGVFNGSRFRAHIQPKIRDFIRASRAMVAPGQPINTPETAVAAVAAPAKIVAAESAPEPTVRRDPASASDTLA